MALILHGNTGGQAPPTTSADQSPGLVSQQVPQGVTGLDAVKRSLARGVRGFGQAQEQLGIPSVIMPALGLGDAERNFAQNLDQTARQPLSPEIGLAGRAGLAAVEAAPSIAALGPAGFASTGPLMTTALGALGGGAASLGQFNEVPASGLELGQQATQGLATGGILGGLGGAVMRLLRGNNNLFKRGKEISNTLKMGSVISGSKPSRSIFQAAKVAEREDPVFLELAEQAGDTAPVREFQRMLDKMLKPKAIEANLKELDRAAWGPFDSLVNTRMQVNLGPAAKASRELLDQDLLTGTVKVQAKKILRLQESGQPITYGRLRGMRQSVGDLFNTQRVVETVPDRARNKLYGGLTESMKTVFNQTKDIARTAKAFKVGNEVHSKVARGQQVLGELRKAKGPRDVRNFLTRTKKISKEDLETVLGIAPDLKEIRDLASIIVAPGAKVVNPKAVGPALPVGTQALAVGASTHAPETLGAGAVGLDFLRSTFSSGEGGSGASAPSGSLIEGLK